MLSMFRRLARDDRGVTVIEYALIACLISVAAIAALTSAGAKISTVMSNVANQM
jgi:pilus assembly protein Flp/PilA